MKTILSIDPASYVNCGYSIIHYEKEIKDVQAGTFVMKVDKPWKSLTLVYDFVSESIEKHKPDFCILESTGVFRGGFVTSQVSQSMGAILAACGKHGIPVEFEYPTHVKKKISNAGKATKVVMKKCVKKIFEKLNIEVKFDSEHSIDAAANILCWMFDQNIIKNPIIEE